MGTPFPHAERAQFRLMFSNLEKMIEQAESVGKGLIAPPPGFFATLEGLTGTVDLEGQHRALVEVLAKERDAYMERLTALARKDLTAFAEVINPDQPPANHHIYLCDRLHDVMDGKIENIGLSMPPGHAKDLDVDTPVLMASGAYKRLGDIRVGDDVITMHGRAREVLAVHDQGVRPVLRIATANGRVIRPHPDHLFLTPRGWVKAGELTTNDSLAVVREFEIPDASGRSVDEFIFAGYMTSFGFARDRTSSHLFKVADAFRTSDTAIKDDFIRVAKRLGFQARPVSDLRYNQRAWTIRLCGKAVLWLQECGLHDYRKDTIRTPEWVFHGDEGRIAAFLGALFSTNSTFAPSVHPQSKAANLVVVRLRNAGIIHDVQQLLMRLGVNAKRGSIVLRNYNYRQASMFSLTIADAHDQRRIQASVRLVGAQAVLWSREIPIRGFDSRAEYHEDRVLSIRPDGECETRCITVEEDSSFVAGDVVVHNSTYASHLFPAFWLGNRPTAKFLQGSHTQSFVETDMSARVRAIMSSEEFATIFPEVALHDTRKAVRDWWLANEKGRYKALGVNKASAGVRSTCVNIDDPYPSIEEARSSVYRDKAWRWFTTDMRSRRLPDCPTIVIHTRWHTADIIGRVEKMLKDGDLDENWEIINIPLVSYGIDEDPLRRPKDELLWPTFYTEKAMKSQKAPMDAREWLALYQGKPTPEDGDVIKSGWLQYYDSLPANDPDAEDPEDRNQVRRIIVSVDTKKKEQQRGDWSAIAVLLEDRHRLINIAEVKRDRWLYNDLEREIDRAVLRWGADVCLVEPEGMGAQYLNTRKDNPPGGAALIEANHGNKSKEFRVDATLGHWQNGTIRLPKYAPWLADLMTEVLEFPNSHHDDQLDAVTHGVAYLTRGSGLQLGSRKLKGR